MRLRFVFCPLITACLIASGLLAAEASPAKSLAGLAPRSRELLVASLKFSDGFWDDGTALLWSPAAEDIVFPGQPRPHRVRETSWYALGLLLRDAPGDQVRALRALRAVLAQQMVAPGEDWDGTFFRSPGEPPPKRGAIAWHEYDPNWRQFIGTTFALVLLDFEARLPADLRAQLATSIVRAVEGELHQGRLHENYTNIALMHGFLWSFAGERFHRPEWVKQGEAWTESVYRLYKEHDAFEEYNSPTYYGVDLYALALCRAHGVTPRIRALGAEMEAGLWRDIAGYYHAGLKNLSGPFDRAYGMDMRRYVSLVGTWLGLVLPPDLTPLPDPSGPMDHAHDYVVVPTYVVLGAQVPADALEHFKKFQGEHQLTRPITGPRVATAWLGEKVMLGGEFTGLTRSAVPPESQFHPATIYWRLPDGGVGWILLQASPRVDARAEKNRLSIEAVGDSTFRVNAPGLTPAQVARDRWTLPGLMVEVQTDSSAFSLSAAEGGLDAHYRGATRFVLRTLPP
jgi:hypothetical protein